MKKPVKFRPPNLESASDPATKRFGGKALAAFILVHFLAFRIVRDVPNGKLSFEESTVEFANRPVLFSVFLAIIVLSWLGFAWLSWKAAKQFIGQLFR